MKTMKKLAIFVLGVVLMGLTSCSNEPSIKNITGMYNYKLASSDEHGDRYDDDRTNRRSGQSENHDECQQWRFIRDDRRDNARHDLL